MPLKLVKQRNFIGKKSFEVMFCMQFHKIFIGAVSIIRKQVEMLQIVLSGSQKGFVAVKMLVIHKSNVVRINKKTCIGKNSKISVLSEMTLIYGSKTN